MSTKLVTLVVFVGALLMITCVVMAADVAVISQNHRSFSVPAVEIVRGAILRFTNDDKFVHQIYVASPTTSYESDEQQPGTNVEISFPAAGVFEVRCHIHPKMLLQVKAR